MSSLIWFYGENICTNWRVPKMTYLQHPSTPFCLSFPIYHSLFDTSFIQFTTLITKVQIIFLYAIIMLLLHNSYKKLVIFKSLILLLGKSSNCDTSSGCNTSLLQFQVGTIPGAKWVVATLGENPQVATWDEFTVVATPGK